MPELLKLLWDLIVLRDAQRKGQLNRGTWIFAGGFLLVLYGVALPILLVYLRYPGQRWLLIAGILVAAMDVAALVWYVIAGRRRRLAEERAS